MVLGAKGFLTLLETCLTRDTFPGSLAQVLGYAIQAPAPPFPVFVLGYVLNGFGIALQVGASLCGSSQLRSLTTPFQDAGANGYVASLKDNAATKMGILHALYGTYS